VRRDEQPINFNINQMSNINVENAELGKTFHYCNILKTCYLKYVVFFRDKRGGGEQVDSSYEGWNFNSGNYLFTTDTK
jgi:hypothetical protein